MPDFGHMALILQIHDMMYLYLDDMALEWPSDLPLINVFVGLNKSWSFWAPKYLYKDVWMLLSWFSLHVVPCKLFVFMCIFQRKNFKEVKTSGYVDCAFFLKFSSTWKQII